jgi:predicted component of type VI protein secretion system
MPAQLVALTEGPNILLDKPILLLGRHLECDIQIDSRKVSRRHCCIAQVNDYLVVRDLGSTNGIRINGVRVPEGRLLAGDELTIGSHRYQVRWDAVPGQSPPPRGRDTVRSYLPDGEDELLESCDEPVPLDEPSPPSAAGAAPRSPALPADSSDPPSPPPGEEPFILPEHLELLPNSGTFPKIPNPSGSHHPAR